MKNQQAYLVMVPRWSGRIYPMREMYAWNSGGKLRGQKQGTQSHCYWEGEATIWNRVAAHTHTHTDKHGSWVNTRLSYKYPTARRGGTYYPVWETLECCKGGETGHYLDFNTLGIRLDASSDVDHFKTCWITLAEMFLNTLSRPDVQNDPIWMLEICLDANLGKQCWIKHTSQGSAGLLMTDGVVWWTDSAGRRRGGRRCQRELDRGHKRISTLMISGKNRRRPVDIVVFERVELSRYGGISHTIILISRW